MQKINPGMGNIIRRKKHPKGINNWTLDTDKVQEDLTWNLFDKCTIWYHCQNSEQPLRWRVSICNCVRTRIRLNHNPMIIVTTIFYH